MSGGKKNMSFMAKDIEPGSLVVMKKAPNGSWYDEFMESNRDMFDGKLSIRKFVGECVARGYPREVVIAACELHFNCNRGAARDAWGRAVNRCRFMSGKKGPVCRTPTKKAIGAKAVKTMDVSQVVRLVRKAAGGIKEGCLCSDSDMHDMVSDGSRQNPITKKEWETYSKLDEFSEFRINLSGKRYNGVYWGRPETIQGLSKAICDSSKGDE